jgi:nitroimidazol reductase NimA-like FMN-containing flavoprotein (pyridoxamine 5'-phosphate oxidase superfamily)
MSDNYDVNDRNRVRQLRDNANYERKAVHRVLDAALFVTAGFVQDGGPVVVPMIHGRDGETVYLHGARKARIIRLLDETDQVCLNATLVDGIVLARSAFNSSMNYRSATVFGSPRLLEDREDKIRGMRVISEHLMPGRWDELRAPLEKEIRMTGVIEVTIESASAKLASGMPEDEDEDYAIPVWAGVLPVESTLRTLIDDDRLLAHVEPSAFVKALQNRTL